MPVSKRRICWHVFSYWISLKCFLYASYCIFPTGLLVAPASKQYPWKVLSTFLVGIFWWYCYVCVLSVFIRVKRDIVSISCCSNDSWWLGIRWLILFSNVISVHLAMLFLLFSVTILSVFLRRYWFSNLLLTVVFSVLFVLCSLVFRCNCFVCVHYSNVWSWFCTLCN